MHSVQEFIMLELINQRPARQAVHMSVCHYDQTIIFVINLRCRVDGFRLFGGINLVIIIYCCVFIYIR